MWMINEQSLERMDGRTDVRNIGYFTYHLPSNTLFLQI